MAALFSLFQTPTSVSAGTLVSAFPHATTASLLCTLTITCVSRQRFLSNPVAAHHVYISALCPERGLFVSSSCSVLLAVLRLPQYGGSPRSSSVRNTDSSAAPAPVPLPVFLDLQVSTCAVLQGLTST